MDFETGDGETGGGGGELDNIGADKLLSAFEEDVKKSSSSERTTGSVESPVEKRRFDKEQAGSEGLGGTVASCKRDKAAEESSNALILLRALIVEYFN